MDPLVVGPAIKVLKEIYETAERRGLVDRVLDTFRRKHRVLVLGESGTGKTQLITSLNQLMPQALDRINDRTEVSETYRLQLNDNLFEFIDTPGEKREVVLQTVRESLQQGVNGVLDVVCYGYHEGRGTMSDAVTKDNKVKPIFLRKRRTAEIDFLANWSAILGGDATIWCITVITKADLWWSQRPEITQHYRRGEYAQAQKRAGLKHPSVIEYCSRTHRYFNVVPIDGTFDDGDRLGMRSHLLRTLIATIGKGGTRLG